MLVLNGYENSSVVGVGRFRPVFYIMCYVMQDSSSRVRLSTELDECVCLLGALSGPTASSPCSHGRGSVWLAP